uniref:SCP domain-containing protein n=1 Tax=Angiostrongylus cantonensis TaxID=6313 RepID=A0A0K0DH83_ANGCA
MSDWGCQFFEWVNHDCHGQIRVDENCDAADSSTAACTEAELFSGATDDVKRTMFCCLSGSYDVVLYPSCVRVQVFC